MKRFFLKWVVVSLFLLLSAPVATRTQAQSGNRLNNGGLEGPFSNGVATGWAPWHQEQGKLTCGTSKVLPTWFEESNSSLILQGSRSQGIGNRFDTWQAGVFQTVSGLTPGAKYRFTFSGRMFGSNSDFGTTSSDGIGIMRAGIDPNGSGLWYDADVVWSGAIAPHGGWQQVFVEVVATADKVSVFTEANYSNNSGYCASHLDSWVDQAELVQVSTGGTVPTPITGGGNPAPNPVPVVIITPGPTATPNEEGIIYYTVPAGGSLWMVAADTGLTLEELRELNNLSENSVLQPGQLLIVGFADVTPEATLEPQGGLTPTEAVTATPDAVTTPTVTPPPSGTLCLNAFNDLDANGLRADTDGYMAGVTFTLSQGNNVMGQTVSRGLPEPVCFENIAAGTYQIAQILPASLEATTATNFSLDLVAGQAVSLEFGSRIRTDLNVTEVATSNTPESQPVATSSSPTTESGGGLSITAISGLVLIVVAILLLGGLILLVSRQRG